MRRRKDTLCQRSTRDGGGAVEWDISAVSADGGLPASEAVASREAGRVLAESEDRLCWLRCALPDMCVVEWHLHGPHPDLPCYEHDGGVDSYFVIEGELEAILAATRRTVDPGTLISVPRGTQHTLNHRGPKRARVLSLHTPDGGLAEHLRGGCGAPRSPVD
jgi:hypothetical protein